MITIKLMIEFEARFSLDADISGKLLELGFENSGKRKMADIIFEPKDWIPGAGLKQGYFVVRIRLVEGKKPAAEIKEFVDDMRWRESSFEISEPAALAVLLSKAMVGRRVISKIRETWKKSGVEIAVDEVEKLGKFVEVEGEENSVKETISELGFDLKNKKPNYGSMLFYLEKEGKIKFSEEEFSKTLESFGY